MPVDPILIKVNLERDNLFPEISLVTLRERYLLKGEVSPQQAFARASAAFADDLGHAQRLYDYSSKHWFMFSTPILANSGSNKNMPISCFGGYVEDTLEGIFHHYTETGKLTATGGGTSGYWGAVRSNQDKDSKSNGKINWLRVVDTLMDATSQAKTRRGSNAVYLDCTDPDIEEFVEIRDPQTGNINRKCLSIGFHIGVNVTTKFREAIRNNSSWELIDPHTKTVTKTIQARDLWKKIITQRRKLGEPYLLFVDTVNEYYPNNLKKKGLMVSASNLCNEIMLHSGPDYNGKNRTFICCLSSVNHSKFDEWEGEAAQMYEDIVRMLDNVLQFFIENAPPEAHQAVYSASMTRDIGVGSMGFHHYLQSKMIPFESQAASDINNKLYYLHAKHCSAATKKLGEERGYYPDAYDFDGKLMHRARNATTMAIAPNASSGIICGNTSPSIEPYSANAYKHTTLSGSFLSKNPVLESLLDSKSLNTSEIWSNIIAHDGSVQQLKELTDEEKLVFKTFVELDQMWVIEHAALRQLFLDQGQSVNLKFAADTTVKHINDCHMSAWDKGLKGLYYLRSTALKASERIGVVKSRETVDPDQIGCSMCEG